MAKCDVALPAGLMLLQLCGVEYNLWHLPPRSHYFWASLPSGLVVRLLGRPVAPKLIRQAALRWAAAKKQRLERHLHGVPRPEGFGEETNPSNGSGSALVPPQILSPHTSTETQMLQNKSLSTYKLLTNKMLRGVQIGVNFRNTHAFSTNASLHAILLLMSCACGTTRVAACHQPYLHVGQVFLFPVVLAHVANKRRIIM